MIDDKCFVYGIRCEKDSCKGCPGQEQRIRDRAIVAGALTQAEINSRPLTDEQRLQMYRDEKVKALNRIADSQFHIANQLYWLRRYKKAGL